MGKSAYSIRIFLFLAAALAACAPAAERGGPGGHEPGPGHGGSGFRGEQRGFRGEHGEHGGPRYRVQPWHGDIRSFPRRDLRSWRDGHWFHGPHWGRDGWWWIVGLTWYWYPAPVYPYPDPYQPPLTAEAPPPDTGAPAQFWFYCPDPPGYYPYVPQCNEDWQTVPAQQ